MKGKTMPRCKHGMFVASNGDPCCAICKDWPSADKMRSFFPDLPDSVVAVMTPEERREAIKTGRLIGITPDEIQVIIREEDAERIDAIDSDTEFGETTEVLEEL